MLDSNKISNKIMNRRLELGISQSEMAKMLGVMPASVARWETEANLLRPKNLVLMCSILDLSIDELLFDSKNLNNKEYYSYKFAKYFNTNSTELGNLNYKEIKNNPEDFLYFYINVVDRLRELYIEKIKGNKNINEEYEYLFNGLSSYHCGAIKVDFEVSNNLAKIPFKKEKNNMTFFYSQDIYDQLVKISKIDDCFDYNKIDYIFETKEEQTGLQNERLISLTKHKISNRTLVKYSKINIELVGNYNNHQEIRENSYYVEDINGNRAIVEVLDISKLEYDPTIHTRFIFDRMEEFIKLDDKILGICLNKPKLLEKYLISLPDYRYNFIKKIYIEQCIAKDKFFSFGDVFLKLDYLKKKEEKNDV